MIAVSTAYAADTQANSANSASQQAADHDFGKFSKDGNNAFRAIRDARLAIFDGQANKAKTDIDNAQTALQKAKSDDSVFTKAESELKQPAGMTQSGTTTTASTTPTAWLPVNGTMAVDEDYAASPAKAKGVAKADTQLKQGDRKSAMQTLKLADVGVVVIIAVAPLQSTLSGIDKAKQLADAGHFFQANQALKAVEDSVRFDEASFVGTPKAGQTDQNRTK